MCFLELPHGIVILSVVKTAKKAQVSNLSWLQLKEIIVLAGSTVAFVKELVGIFRLSSIHSVSGQPHRVSVRTCSKWTGRKKPSRNGGYNVWN